MDPVHQNVQRSQALNVPAAPARSPLPLPSSPPTQLRPPVPPAVAAVAAQPSSEVSYDSITPSEREVFHRKVARYRDWTAQVTREGGADFTESTMGRAGGVGSASWETLPTIKVMSRDGTEPSTIVNRREGVRETTKDLLAQPRPSAPQYVPMIAPSNPPPPEPRPVVASRIVETPAPMSIRSPIGPVPPQSAVTKPVPDLPKSPPPPDPPIKTVSRQPTRTPVRKESPTPHLARPPVTTVKSGHVPPPLDRYTSDHIETLAVPAGPVDDRRLSAHSGQSNHSGHSGHSTHSAYREREAYINSALNLPLDMLSEKQADQPSSSKKGVKRWTSLLKSGTQANGASDQQQQGVPSQSGSRLRKLSLRSKTANGSQLNRSNTVGGHEAKQSSVKPADAAMSSVSLPNRDKSSLQSRKSTRKPLPDIASEGDPNDPPAEPPKPVLGSPINLSEPQRPTTASHPHSRPHAPHTTPYEGGTPSGSQLALAPSKVPAQGSAASGRSHRPEQALAAARTPSQRTAQNVPASGSAASGKSRQVEQTPTRTQHPDTVPSTHSRAQDVPALGSAASSRAQHTAVRPSAPPNSPESQQQTPHSRVQPVQQTRASKTTPTAIPTAQVSQRPTELSRQDSHRQQLALPRPALSRSIPSIDGLTKTLGRRMRDPSLTNLTAHFEPEMYPLPDSLPTADARSPSPVKPSVHEHRSTPHTSSFVVPPATGHTLSATGPVPATEHRSTHLAPSAVPYGQPVAATQRFSHLQPSAAPSGQNVTSTQSSTLADRHSKTITPVQITPELQHPKPLSAVTPKLPEVDTPPQAVEQPQHHDRSSYHVASPSERRDVRFTPMSSPRRRDTEDEVRFEVPSRSNGRVRVSVAWLRDRQGQATATSGDDSPPALPPKAPASITDRFRRRDRRQQVDEDEEDFLKDQASPPPISAPLSPLPLGHNFFNPYTGLPMAPYSPPLNPYTLQQPLGYPQPGMQYIPWMRPGQQQQQAGAKPTSQRPPSPPRPPSIDPPSSGGTPPSNHAELPQAPNGHLNMSGPGKDMPWYGPQAQPPAASHHAPPSQHPNQWGYVNRPQRQNEGGPSIWRRMFGNKSKDPNRRNDYNRNRWPPQPAPSHRGPPTVVSARGPMTNTSYRDPRYRPPMSQRSAWWRREPNDVGYYRRASPRHDEDHRGRYDDRRDRRDRPRRERREGTPSVFDYFLRRRTDEIHIRSPRRRNMPLPSTAPSNHQSQQPRDRRYEQTRKQDVLGSRPRLRERLSDRWFTNANARPSRPIAREAQSRNIFSSRADRLAVTPAPAAATGSRPMGKDEKRLWKRQRREARVQRRREGQGSSTRPILNGGVASISRGEGRGRTQTRDAPRVGATGNNARGRDMSMVGEWRRAVGRVLAGRDAKDSRSRLGGSTRP